MCENIIFYITSAYLFPTAAVTNKHHLGDSWIQHKFILPVLESGSLKLRTHNVGFFWNLWEGICSMPLWWLLTIGRFLWLKAANSLSPFSFGLSCVFSFPVRTFVVSFRATLIQYALISRFLIPSAKTHFRNKITVPGSRTYHLEATIQPTYQGTFKLGCLYYKQFLKGEQYIINYIFFFFLAWILL